MKKRVIFDIYSDENYEDLENNLQEVVCDYLSSQQINATCQVRENRYITIHPHRKKEVLNYLAENGYIARRSYTNIEALMITARAMRNQKEK